MKKVSRWRVVCRKWEILRVLEDGKFYSRREILQELGLKSTVVTQTALNELVNTGQVEVSDAFYSLSREVKV